MCAQVIMTYLVMYVWYVLPTGTALSSEMFGSSSVTLHEGPFALLVVRGMIVYTVVDPL